MRGAALLAIGCALAACGRAPVRRDAMPLSDEQLVKAVRAAAAAGAAPDRVEALIGKKATVNTQRDPQARLLLRGATIYPDDAAQTRPLSFEDARDVVFWNRDVPARNAPIVGIVWKPDGTAEAFTAFVLPP
jgi:hypothetical protein